MRIITKSRKRFHGTHKGADIEIDREPDGRFYITVTWKDGGHLYDGWAPEDVRTMREAKREAVRGACLDRPAESSPDVGSLQKPAHGNSGRQPIDIPTQPSNPSQQGGAR